MSVVLERASDAANPPPANRRRVPGRASVLWPTLVAALNATAVFLVSPNVGDLQAALARQSAAAKGVGLTYWFPWYGGGSTPGSYSIIAPTLSALLHSALLVGGLSTVAITPLARRALTGLRFTVAATWLVTAAAATSLWSGRIPFALGCAVGLVGIIGLRERRLWVAILGLLGTCLCSPVTGAFIGAGLLASFLVDPGYRRWTFPFGAALAATMLAIAIVFGAPGPQTFTIASAVFVTLAALSLQLARPVEWLRVLLWMVAVAAPILAIIPNGLGSNISRLPWVVLPAVVLATATAPARRVVFALALPVVMMVNQTASDLYNAAQPQASARYYDSLVAQLRAAPDVANHRLEVVLDPDIHTAAYALLDHAMLAGGYETQEQNRLNAILSDEKHLNAITYRVWLQNNAVGYVGFNNGAPSDSPEYQLIAKRRPAYLQRVSGDAKWTLFRVQNPTPIVPAPQVLVSSTQAQLTMTVPCACTFPVRVRYSPYLSATSTTSPDLSATVADDGTGWTVVTTRRPGTYVLGA